jgi:hypothetical protein
MKLWMSGEIQADIADSYRGIRNSIEIEVNRLLNNANIDIKIQEWAVIPIILSENITEQYPEVVKKSVKGTSFECRLKIPHANFLSANVRHRIKLIFQVLLRSVDLMKDFGVSIDIQNSLRTLLVHAEREIAAQNFIN